jgi:hypothetical protein
MVGLNDRVGIEGFFCIVRSSPDFHMRPQFYFTSQQLEEYMGLCIRKKWDTAEVGTKVEAFAVAGSNVLSTFLNLYSDINGVHCLTRYDEDLKGEVGLPERSNS